MGSVGKVLNIEVGDRLTKVCLSVPKGRAWQIRTSFMFQTPEGAVSDGQLNTPEVLAAQLAGELKARGLHDVKNAVFTLTSGKIASREVTLPPVKDNRLREVVQANAPDYFPVDMTKYHVAYLLLERRDKGEDAGCRVMVYAAPLQLLEPYFQLAEKAGLTVKAVDYSGNSQFQALRALASSTVTMYVNVDCTNSCVTVTQDGTLLLQRTFTFGGDELITTLLSATGREPAASGAYLDALHEASDEEPDFLKKGTLSAADVSESLSRLVGNIERSSDYFNSSHWEHTVERVVLMGPCSRLVGLRGMVANATGLDTTCLEEIPGISSLANAAESASFYISCLGAPLAPLDLIPPQFALNRKKNRRVREKSDSSHIRDGLILCGICFAAAAALCISAVLAHQQAADEKAALDGQIAQLSYTKDVYNDYTGYQNAVQALTDLDDTIASPNDGLTAFIGELEEKMPSDILVLSASCTRDSVVLNITVPGYEEMAVVLVQLRSFDTLGTITASAATETTDDSGITTVSFSVSCAYAAAEQAAAEAAAAAAAQAAADAAGTDNTAD